MISNPAPKLRGVLLGGAVVLLMNVAHAQTATAPTQTGSGAGLSAPLPAAPQGAPSTPSGAPASAPETPTIQAPSAGFSIVVAPPAGAPVTVTGRHTAARSTTAHTATARTSTVRRSPARHVAGRAPGRAPKSTAKSTRAPHRIHSVSKARQAAAWKDVERGDRATRAKTTARRSRPIRRR